MATLTFRADVLLAAVLLADELLAAELLAAELLAAELLAAELLAAELLAAELVPLPSPALLLSPLPDAIIQSPLFELPPPLFGGLDLTANTGKGSNKSWRFLQPNNSVGIYKET
jgi:hypothetical protein